MWVYIEELSDGSFEIRKSDAFPGANKNAVNGGSLADTLYDHAVKQANGSSTSQKRDILEGALEVARTLVLAGMKPS